MYSNILIPVIIEPGQDHSKALRFARLVSGQDADVTMLHVLERLPTYMMPYIPEKASLNLRTQLQLEMNRLVEDIPEATGEIITGHPGRAIVEYANRHAADLIVVAPNRSGLEAFFLGSTAGYVVRHAKCSVHVIR